MVKKYLPTKLSKEQKIIEAEKILKCPNCGEDSQISNELIFNKLKKFLNGELKESFLFPCSKCGKVSNVNNWYNTNYNKLKLPEEKTNLEMVKCDLCSTEILKTTYSSNKGLCNSCKEKESQKKAKDGRSLINISGATIFFILISLILYFIKTCDGSH